MFGRGNHETGRIEVDVGEPRRVLAGFRGPICVVGIVGERGGGEVVARESGDDAHCKFCVDNGSELSGPEGRATRYTYDNERAPCQS